MTAKINFAFGVHNHQPIGNFEHVFDQAFKRCYGPFLKILKRYPDFKISLHYSGILFDWLHKNRPEALDDIAELVKRGQVELLTGGFYEPILPVIPEWDQKGQIDKLTNFVQTNFKTTPTGMWLAERVWEPHLPEIISQCGVKFVILDDTHFKYAGLTEQQLLGYYVTEEQGFPVNLFPISKVLRYTIPFKEPEKTLEYFKEIATPEGNNLIVYADDGEKFGIWPGTYKHCYEDGWMEAFFEAVEKNKDWVKMVHFSEALEKFPPLGRVYLPTSSYAEMSQWSLPPQGFRDYQNLENILKDQKLYEKFGIFVRGGFWRNFLAKYPESNHLHKRMLDLSQRIHSLQSSRRKVDKEKLKKAQDELYKSQCNCPYWHGVFGGLYLNHLREAVYSHLIRAELIYNELIHEKDDWIDHRVFDLDKDGKDELLVSTPSLNLCFSPYSGGALYELDFVPGLVNLTNTLTRREEGYHEKILSLKSQNPEKKDSEVASIHDLALTKEKGLEKYLTYDWYRRGSLIDHFLGESTDIESFSRCQYSEQGDFVNQPYKQRVEKKGKKITVTLERDGWVWVDNKRVPLKLTKTIQLESKTSLMEMTYSIKNNSADPVNLWFGVEFNYSLSSGEGEHISYLIDGKAVEARSLLDKLEDQDVTALDIKDRILGVGINLQVDKPAILWRFPVLTVSLSESGFEKNYQSTLLFPNWKINLGPAQTWKAKIIQRIDLFR